MWPVLSPKRAPGSHQEVMIKWPLELGSSQPIPTSHTIITFDTYRKAVGMAACGEKTGHVRIRVRKGMFQLLTKELFLKSAE